MGIKHKAVKASRETGLASEWNDDHEIDGDVECAQHEHHDHVIENRTNYPAAPVVGQIVYRTDTKTLEVWDGVTWGAYTGGAPTAFQTINCPAGTNPVAELTTDTLNLTEGEGIDITGTEGTDTVNIAGENSTAGNKGVVIVAAGEGIDVGYAAGTATVSGEDATTANKGIASFNSNHFTTSSGAVSSRVSAGEGIDVSATQAISGEDATTANKGIASFNTNDFAVSSGAVSLKNKTSYWSCGGSAFHAVSPDTDPIIYGEPWNDDEEWVRAEGDNIQFMAPVNLPHGAIVTGCIVEGDAAATAETWELSRKTYGAGDGETAMATANIGTEDTSISDATIDNSTYCYFLSTTSLDTNDTIFGARITYTTDYD